MAIPHEAALWGRPGRTPWRHCLTYSARVGLTRTSNEHDSCRVELVMANKQPFYHRMEVLFTATEDTSEQANSVEFKEKLANFLKRSLGPVIRTSVEFDAPVTAEPGDPADLM
jgi:hypothetical protein